MIDIEIMLNPEKHGYKICSHCNGYGSSLKETSDRRTSCSGAGLVRSVNSESNSNDND